MDVALRLDRVTKRYGDHVAVSALSIEVPAGSIYGVLGPNGAGKTTTLRMVNDILAPDEGQIRLLDGLAPGPAAARRIGYLPEERGLYPKMKVIDTLVFFGQLRGLSARVAARRGTTWLERLELAAWAQRKVQDLSKGMQQKVQFAAALIHEPELLILDEPWSGLDPINAEVLREIALEQRAAGRTIVFSTHLMEQAEQICDGVCIIARGRKVVDGPLAEVRREAATRRLIAVAFADGDEIGPRVLADSSAVGSRRERRGFTELELAAEAEASELLSALVGAGADVRRFEVIQPTLHQIFVDKVGAEAARGALPEERIG